MPFAIYVRVVTAHDAFRIICRKKPKLNEQRVSVFRKMQKTCDGLSIVLVASLAEDGAGSRWASYPNTKCGLFITKFKIPQRKHSSNAKVR